MAPMIQTLITLIAITVTAAALVFIYLELVDIKRIIVLLLKEPQGRPENGPESGPENASGAAKMAKTGQCEIGLPECTGNATRTAYSIIIQNPKPLYTCATCLNKLLNEYGAQLTTDPTRAHKATIGVTPTPPQTPIN